MAKMQVKESYDAGHDAYDRGDYRVAPLGYNDLHKDLWYAGYDDAESMDQGYEECNDFYPGSLL